MRVSLLVFCTVCVTLASGQKKGLNGDVSAMSFLGSNLYVVGGFSEAGEVTANQVAMWDGVEWHALGIGLTGIDSSADALAKSGSNIFVGGWFSDAGGKDSHCVAMWNGSDWIAFPGGADRGVLALAGNGSVVYAGGFFENIGGQDAQKVAMWNGSAWGPLGGGLSATYGNPVNSLAVMGSMLFAGGGFTGGSAKTLQHIAMWNGTDWYDVGGGVDAFYSPTVNAIAVDGSKVYVGGQLTQAGGVSASNVAMWDGVKWHALGSGVDAGVNALAVVDSKLYAGGGFHTAGGKSVNLTAMWDGSEWHALGSGVRGDSNEVVSAIAVSGSTVYFGGSFSVAGGQSVTNLASWNGTDWNPVGLVSPSPSPSPSPIPSPSPSPSPSPTPTPTPSSSPSPSPTPQPASNYAGSLLVAAGAVTVVAASSSASSAFASKQAAGVLAVKGSTTCARQLMLTEADCSQLIDASFPVVDYYRRALMAGFATWEGAQIWQSALFLYLRSSFVFQLFRVHIAFIVGRPSEILASIVLLPCRFCYRVRPKIGAGLLDMDVMLDAMAQLTCICLRLAFVNYGTVSPSFGGHFAMSLLATFLTTVVWFVIKRPYTKPSSAFWTEKRRYLVCVGAGFLVETLCLILMATSPFDTVTDHGASVFGLFSDLFLAPFFATLATLALGIVLGNRFLAMLFPEETTPEYPRFQLLRDLYDTDDIEKLHMNEAYTPLNVDVDNDENELLKD